MFPLFETIKILEGEPQHLSWHQLRMNRSCSQYYNTSEVPGLAKLIHVPPEYAKGVVKCKFQYSIGKHGMEFSHYIPRSVKSLQIVYDDKIEYNYKYSDRRKLDALSMLKGSCDEILIVKNGLITDTSYSNIVFFDGKHWETPGNPLLNGTCRMRLIAENRIVEKEIVAGDLGNYKTFKLINAMMDFDMQEAIPVREICF